MKIILIAIIGMLFSCSPPTSDCSRMRERIIKDSTELAEIRIAHSESVREMDSIKYLSDSLHEQLFLAQYKVVKVKKYLNICLNDKTGSQDKYLKGWVKRAIE